MGHIKILQTLGLPQSMYNIIWAYAMTAMRHGLHAHKMPMTDRALVIRGIFAEVQAVVEETLWR